MTVDLRAPAPYAPPARKGTVDDADSSPDPVRDSCSTAPLGDLCPYCSGPETD